MLAALGLGLMGAGQIWGGLSGYKDSKKSAKLAKYNAMLAEQAAKEKIEETGYNQRLAREESERVAGYQKASLGASGNVVGEGANLAVQQEQKRQADIEDFLIGYQGIQEAKALRQQATNFSQQASQYSSQGRYGMWGSMLGAGGTFLSGFGGLFGNKKPPVNANSSSWSGYGYGGDWSKISYKPTMYGG